MCPQDCRIARWRSAPSVPVGDTVGVTQRTAAPPQVGVGTAGATTARFVTGEAVSLDLPVARLGSRMLARAIDIVVQVGLFSLLSLTVTLLVMFAEGIGLLAVDAALLEGLAIVEMVAVVVGYPVAMETLTGGRTLGKLALGLRVVREDGGPIRLRQALTRSLVGAAVEWPGLLAPPLTWLAGLWTMAVSRQGKRLGDYAAGTVVVHQRTAGVWAWVVPMPPPLARWATTLDLAGLDDELALAVRQFLARYRELREPARRRLARALAGEVAAATTPPPPPGTPDVAYLAAVHAERHRRTLHRLAAVRARSAALWPELHRPWPTPPRSRPSVPAPTAPHPPGPRPSVEAPPLRSATPPPAPWS